MKETLTYLRNELNKLYPPRETEAVIRLIFKQLKGWDPVDIVLNEDKPLSEYMQGKIHAIVERLKRREPIQYVLGTAYFYGLDFKVTPDVLIPRPETAELVDMIVKQAEEKSDLRVLDAGTGSGCIAIALRRNLKFPVVVGIDKSEAALKVAEENARTLRCSDIKFVQTDMLSLRKSPSLAGQTWDIIVSNPPYIAPKEAADMEPNVLDYEPHTALFTPENDPLIFYRALADYGQHALNPDGRIYFEINPLYTSDLVEEMERRDYRDVTLYRDFRKQYRFLSASSPGRDNY